MSAAESHDTHPRATLVIWQGRSDRYSMRAQWTISRGDRTTQLTWFRDDSFHFQTWSYLPDAPGARDVEIAYGAECNDGSLLWLGIQNNSTDTVVGRWGPEIDELFEIRAKGLPAGRYDL